MDTLVRLVAPKLLDEGLLGRTPALHWSGLRGEPPSAWVWPCALVALIAAVTSMSRPSIRLGIELLASSMVSGLQSFGVSCRGGSEPVSRSQPSAVH